MEIAFLFLCTTLLKSHRGPFREAAGRELDRALARSEPGSESATEDSISPAFYELEQGAIFGRTWLNVGRG